MVESSPPALWRQALAMVYDTLLVAPLLMVNALIWVVSFGPTNSVQEASVPPLLIQLSSAAVVMIFFSIFWLKSGQTLGMQAWRIKLVAVEGSGVSWRQCLLRCLGALLSALPAGLGYWWSLLDTDSRTWHDRLSGTKLVKVPKAKAQ